MRTSLLFLVAVVVGGVVLSADAGITLSRGSSSNRCSCQVPGLTRPPAGVTSDTGHTFDGRVLLNPGLGYAYALDLVSQARSTGSTWTTDYYGYDGLGSVRYLTHATSGAVTDTYTYDAFGILIGQTPSSGQTVNNYRYTGEQWDPDLGMYYLRARYLNPTTGRFWTADSYEGSQSDPLSLHKYLYAADNPVNNIDPSGQTLTGIIEFFSTAAIEFSVRTMVLVAQHPVAATAIGLTINLMIPEQIDQALIGSGIPGFTGLSAVRQGEVRLLKAMKNSTVSRFLTQSARGLLSNAVGHAFESFAARVLFRGPGLEQEVSTGRYIVDFIWRGRLFELKTCREFSKGDPEQLAEFASYASKNSLDLVYLFLVRPTPATINKIEAAGGTVVSIFD